MSETYSGSPTSTTPATPQIRRASRLGARGFAMMESLLVVAGIGLMAVATISLQDSLTRNEARMSVLRQLSEVRRMILENLNNPGTWDSLVNNPKNGISVCLSDAEGDCDYTPPKPMHLEVSALSNLTINPEDPATGFQVDLKSCSTFKKEDSQPNQCPFRAELTWQPVCSVGGDCKQIEVTVDLKADPRFETMYTFSTSAFSFKLRRNLDLKRTTAVPGSRKLSFDASSTAPKSVKVFLVLDNSTSMTDDREILADGLASFVDGMKGFDVKYYVYTTDSLIGTSAWRWPFEDDENDQIRETTTYSWNEGGTFFLPDGSTFNSTFSWNKVSQQKFLRWTGKNSLRPDMAKIWNLDLHQTHDQTNLNGIKATLKNVLSRIEDKNASNEAGLCTLARILNDDGPNNPLQPGDSAVFLVMSDEDDTGYIYEDGQHFSCGKEAEVKPKSPTDVWSGWCDPAKAPCDSLLMELQIKDTEVRTIHWDWISNDKRREDWHTVCETKTPGDCGVMGATSACTEADLPWGPQPGWRYGGNCFFRVERWSQQEDYRLRKEKFPGGVLPTDESFCKKPFTYDGVTYADGKDYAVRAGGLDASRLHDNGACWTGYQQDEPDHYAWHSVLNSGLAPTMPGEKVKTNIRTPMTDLYTSLPSRFRELFGADGYGLYMVVHDAAKDAEAGCSMDPLNASYGTKYRDLLMASDTPGNLFSVCQKSYATSMENMKAQAQQIARDTYVVDPFDVTKERIYSVQVQRGSTPIIVNRSDYGFTGANLQFKAGFIQSGDKITVVIVPK